MREDDDASSFPEGLDFTISLFFFKERVYLKKNIKVKRLIILPTPLHSTGVYRSSMLWSTVGGMLLSGYAKPSCHWRRLRRFSCFLKSEK